MIHHKPQLGPHGTYLDKPRGTNQHREPIDQLVQALPASQRQPVTPGGRLEDGLHTLPVLEQKVAPLAANLIVLRPFGDDNGDDDAENGDEQAVKGFERFRIVDICETRLDPLRAWDSSEKERSFTHRVQCRDQWRTAESRGSS